MHKTNLPKLVILISGNGSNLQAIIDAIADQTLLATITLVISNRKDAYGLTRADRANIPIMYLPFLSNRTTREKYETELLNSILVVGQPNLIVCAGWMHILGFNFLNALRQQNIPIINLHPALPGMFPGKNAVWQAWQAYQKGQVNRAGCMVHYVIPELDAGEVIEIGEVIIDENDTEETLKCRIQLIEKPTLLKAIHKVLDG